VDYSEIKELSLARQSEKYLQIIKNKPEVTNMYDWRHSHKKQWNFIVNYKTKMQQKFNFTEYWNKKHNCNVDFWYINREIVMREILDDLSKLLIKKYKIKTINNL